MIVYETIYNHLDNVINQRGIYAEYCIYKDLRNTICNNGWYFLCAVKKHTASIDGYKWLDHHFLHIDDDTTNFLLYLIEYINSYARYKTVISGNVECCLEHPCHIEMYGNKKCYLKCYSHKDTKLFCIDGNFIYRRLCQSGLKREIIHEVESAVLLQIPFAELQRVWRDRLNARKSKENAVLLAKKNHLGGIIGRRIAMFLPEPGHFPKPMPVVASSNVIPLGAPGWI